jgi:DNA-binding NarL/FixJ family response regulator
MKTILLTRRQEQVSGLVSCGMAKKEIANALHISPFTVDHILRSVYDRTDLNKINELTGWWISRHYDMEIDFAGLKKQLLLM